MTKRQLSRHQRDLQLQRITKVGFGALFAAILLIIAFGYWHELIEPGTESMVRVRGVDISTETYAKVLGYRQYLLDSQIANYQAFASSQAAANKPDDQNAALTQQIIDQQIQQLQQQRSGLESGLLDELAGDQLVRQEAAKRGMSVTPTDIDNEIVKAFSPPSQSDNNALTDTATISGTETQSTTATPAPPTATPQTPAQIVANLQKQLSDMGFMSMNEFRDLIITPMILRERLQAVLADGVPTTAEQAWARHILVDKEEDAKDVLGKLQGGADFAALAKDVSTDTSNKDKGGDLGWFTRDAMVPEFSNVAFTLQAGQLVTEPVKSSYGYHVIQSLGHEQTRALSSDQLQKTKDGVLDKWLTAQREDPKAVEYGYSWDRIKWARDWITSHAKYLKAQQAPVSR